MAESDLDFAIDEINREQDRAEAAEKQVAELEATLLSSEWREAVMEREHEIEAQKQRVAELEKELEYLKSVTYCAYCGQEFPLDDEAATKVDEHIQICDAHPLAVAKKRVAELEELLSDRETDLGFEYDRGNDMEKRVTELEDALEEVRDLARTGTPPAAYGMTSLAEWEHYKINRVAGMADFAINK